MVKLNSKILITGVCMAFSCALLSGCLAAAVGGAGYFIGKGVGDAKKNKTAPQKTTTSPASSPPTSSENTA